MANAAFFGENCIWLVNFQDRVLIEFHVSISDWLLQALMKKIYQTNSPLVRLKLQKSYKCIIPGKDHIAPQASPPPPPSLFTASISLLISPLLLLQIFTTSIRHHSHHCHTTIIATKSALVARVSPKSQPPPQPK